MISPQHESRMNHDPQFPRKAEALYPVRYRTGTSNRALRHCVCVVCSLSMRKVK